MVIEGLIIGKRKDDDLGTSQGTILKLILKGMSSHTCEYRLRDDMCSPKIYIEIPNPSTSESYHIWR